MVNDSWPAIILTLIWVGFLRVRFEVGGRGGGGGKITPCLKLIRVMLESWNLVRKYTYTYVVSENMPFGTKAFLILLMLTFFLQKISVFLAMIVPLLKAVLWELC